MDIYDILITYFHLANLDRLPSSGVTRVNSDGDSWKTAGNELTVRWDSTEFEESANISISVLIYQEDGGKGPNWKAIDDIIENATNSGEFKFVGKANTQVFEGNGFGAIRIQTSKDV